jgi:bacterioferritin
MKGHSEIIETLNALLADELTAINQYFLHGEMCEDWGYDRLHEEIEQRAITEMKHAERLIGRILYLEGMPIVSQLNKIHIGDSVLEQFKNDHAAEMDAVKAYNTAIAQSSELSDNGTKMLLESILTDEEGHVDWLEEQFDQIEQMGYEIYLNNQS